MPRHPRNAPRNPDRPRPTAAAAVLALVLVLVAGVPAPVTTAPDGAGAPPTALAVAPSVQRVDGPTASFTVDLGADAPGPARIVATLHRATVEPIDGPTAVGGVARAEDAPVASEVAHVTTAPVTLRPGERTTIEATTATDGWPLVVRVTATATEGAATGPSTVVEALLLSGPPPARAPTLTLDTTPDAATLVSVTTDVATLVNVRVVGAAQLAADDRLLLPGTSRLALGAPARWPLPTVAVVTDELGRTARATIGDRATAGVAAALLLGAALALGLSVRSHRRTRAAHASASSASRRAVDV